MGDTTTDLKDSARKLSESEFVRRHPRAVLVLPTVSRRIQRPLLEDRRDVRQTQVADHEAPSWRETEVESAFRLVVVAPRPGSPFADAVSIGRASELNDVVLDHPTVSKTHAMIYEADGAYFLEDMNSTNGTWLPRGRLGRHERTGLGASEAIVFGELRTIFKTAAALYRTLRAVTGA